MLRAPNQHWLIIPCLTQSPAPPPSIPNVPATASDRLCARHPSESDHPRTFSSMKFKQPSRGTKAATFLPFLISCTRQPLRMAELGCLASTPLHTHTTEDDTETGQSSRPADSSLHSLHLTTTAADNALPPTSICVPPRPRHTTSTRRTSSSAQCPWRGKRPTGDRPSSGCPSEHACTVCHPSAGCGGDQPAGEQHGYHEAYCSIIPTVRTHDQPPFRSADRPDMAAIPCIFHHHPSKRTPTPPGATHESRHRAQCRPRTRIPC